MNRKRKKFPIFLWHRRLGLAAMLLMIILSITGIMLNHTEGLQLDEKPVQSEWLLDWYGLNPQGEPISYSTGKVIISQWDQQLFFNQRSLISSEQTLRGAVALNKMIAIALDQVIILVDNAGELIEQIDTDFDNITRLGSYQQGLIVKTVEDKTYISDKQVISWQAQDIDQRTWSEIASLSEALRQSIKQSFRGEGLTQERVILDLHSGRLFNSQWGIYIMDASAVIIILLSISGTWVWWSRRLKMKSKRHYQKHH